MVGRGRVCYRMRINQSSMDTMQNSEEKPPQAAPASMPEQPSSTVPPMAPTPGTSEAAKNNERRGMAAVSYLGVLCLIPLLLARDSEFAQHHAKQGLVLAILGFLLKIVGDLLWRVPFGGAVVMIAGLALFIVSIIGIVKALSGERFEIPYVSEWAKKVNF
jgi:uncharacterized membrane protein